MSKTLAILSMCAFLSILVAGGHGAGPVGAYCFSDGGGSNLIRGAVLFPMMFLIVSFFTDSALPRRILHLAGVIGLGAVWALAIYFSEAKPVTIMTGALFAGLTVLSLLEVFLFEGSARVPPFKQRTAGLMAIVFGASQLATLVVTLQHLDAVAEWMTLGICIGLFTAGLGSWKGKRLGFVLGLLIAGWLLVISARAATRVDGHLALYNLGPNILVLGTMLFLFCFCLLDSLRNPVRPEALPHGRD